MKKVVVIPARMSSSRFPGKPIKDILGMSMIEHVYRRVKLSTSVDEAYVATCDQEIKSASEGFGAPVIMTSDKHPTCVDRVAEASMGLDADLIINVQGDLPFVRPEFLDEIVQPLLDDEDLLFSDMMGPIVEPAENRDPSVVKVVVNGKGHAVYYSREMIPSPEKSPSDMTVTRYKQFGLNAFRKKGLQLFLDAPQSFLERAESIDMIRMVEHGQKIQMVSSTCPVIGVDTPADLDAAIKQMETDSLFPQYKK